MVSEKKSKMWKVNDGRTTDGRRTTDDGQRVITIVHLSLRLRCTKKGWMFKNSVECSCKRGSVSTLKLNEEEFFCTDTLSFICRCIECCVGVTLSVCQLVSLVGVTLNYQSYFSRKVSHKKSNLSKPDKSGSCPNQTNYFVSLRSALDKLHCTWIYFNDTNAFSKNQKNYF